MIFDQTGSLANMKRHDYLPFGEELVAPISGRSASQGFAGGDGVRQQFTLKERDSETGLDYFLARYYSSIQGRFTSPDEFSGGPDELYFFVDDASANPTFYTDLRNPQSLNKYQYVYNSPLRYEDPDGHEPTPNCCDQETEKRVATGAATGAAVGAVVGGVVGAGTGARTGGTLGLAGGPPGVVVGVVAGGGAGAASGAAQGAVVGALIGGLVGYVYDKVVGPSNPPVVPPVPVTETPPQSPAQPMPPPPPIEVRGGDKLKPDPKAQGPHTTFKTDPKTGKVTKYTTWRPNPRNPTGFDPHKRVDVKPGGRPHRGVPTPHAQGRRIPGGVRPARRNELPK